ncbi:MAG: Panacea domain-containing protein [Sulfurisoma sp.]|nr:Panacea domain-containing protein [Sulfurisoma sp.]
MKPERQKLIQAIVYFAANTKYCGKIKLFKLLYLLDFEHFRQTGKSVTDFEYQAWKFGPVPLDLMEEWEELDEDMASAVHIVEEKVIDYDRQAVKVNEGVAFDPDEFTPRQLRIMEGLAARYRDTYSPKMIDVTHEQNGAWDKVWHGGEGAHRAIPYELAIAEGEPERDALLQIAAEQRMYREALRAGRIDQAA